MSAEMTMMAFGTPGQLIIIALIVLLLFGTKKLRSLGSDLGAAIKGFKKSMGDDEKPTDITAQNQQNDADFTPKSISEQSPEMKKDDVKSQNKEQV